MSRHRSLVTVLAVLFLASPLAAQRPTPNAPVVRDTSLVPRVAPVSIAELSARRDASPSVTLRSFSEQDQSHNTAMMVVGGAALLAGAVVGGKAGTILMIGGSVVGLVGLWNYMK